MVTTFILDLRQVKFLQPCTRKELEEAEAIGGMRNPHQSVAKLPKAKKMGRLVNTLLRKALELWPSLEKTGRAILTGEKVAPMDEKVVDKVRKSVLSLLGCEESQRVRTARASTPLQASVIGAWGKLVGDPDSETLVSWLDHGAPLGYTQPGHTTHPRPTGSHHKAGGRQEEESGDLGSP